MINIIPIWKDALVRRFMLIDKMEQHVLVREQPVDVGKRSWNGRLHHVHSKGSEEGLECTMMKLLEDMELRLAFIRADKNECNIRMDKDNVCVDKTARVECRQTNGCP